MRQSSKKESAEAMEAALFLLKFRGRSEAELAKRLALKKFPPDVLEKTVTRLREIGLLNDEALARQWVEGRRQAGQGEIRIRRILWTRGIPRDIMEKVLSEKHEEEPGASDEISRAWAALTRRTQRLKSNSMDRKTLYRRLGGYLARQGFSADCVHDVLQRYFSKSEESEETSS